MLYDYIFNYIKAARAKDIKQMVAIRIALEGLGMDRRTLLCLVQEFLKKGIETPEDLVKLDEK